MKRLLLYAVAFTFAVTAFLPYSAGAAFGLFSKEKSVTAKQGEVRIPANQVDDGKAHHFVFKDGGKSIGFFVVKSSDGVIRSAFDACDVCFPARKGYTQDGEFMICNNCGRRFHISRINVVQGGCNPAPLKRKQDGNDLVITVTDLRAGARFF